MNDEGVNGDLVAHDGIYGGELTINAPGDYVVRPTLSGFYNDAADLAAKETMFVRSTQHLIAVSPVSLEITGTATMTQSAEDANRFVVVLGVQGTVEGGKLRAYTEVWGKSAETGELAPAAWVGGLVPIIGAADAVEGITLELDTAWLKKAGITSDFVLRNTYLADVITSFAVAVFGEDIVVDSHESVFAPLADVVAPMDIMITKEMRYGVNPLPQLKEKTGIVALPGYCAGGNPWEAHKDIFGADSHYFNGGSLNVGNDEYANLVMDWIQKEKLDSFSLIGHSQGGVVSLHIHNYYFTGLEAATGGRMIQTVGTPWMGCTGAGPAADLANAFGSGCGQNSDLAPDGATLWLAGISMEARKDVYFYTTTYKRNTFFGDYCSLATNAVLKWPNDGITEFKLAKLEGANDMGNKEKWCHTTDMGYPPQYDDEARNTEMAAKAAR
jgi:ADP-dependent glucokinase